MVDRAARNQYAELLRHFASGRMTNREFEDRTEELAFESEDPALRNIWTAAWGLYDDMCEHRLTGRHRLTGVTRREVARGILFLYSDEEYGWPDEGKYCVANFLLGAGCLAGLVSAAMLQWVGVVLVPISALGWSASHSLQSRQRQRVGDDEVWPFLHLSGLDDARRHPRLLAGRH